MVSMGSYFLEMPLEEAMRSQRAMRRLSAEAVPEELLLHLLDLAVRAPSGTNSQAWEFVVVRDRSLVAELGRINHSAARFYMGLGKLAARLGYSGRVSQKMQESFQWQADHFHEIPAVVVACQRGRYFPWPFLAATSYFGSIYPAVQNFLLAARAAGLGTTLITLPLWRVGRIRRALGLPGRVTPCCLIPTGWPLGKFGTTPRRPTAEVVHLDRFGNHPAWPAPGGAESTISNMGG